MRRDLVRGTVPVLALGLLLGMGACSAAKQSSSAPQAEMSTLKAQSGDSANSATDSAETAPTASKPQLIRTARLQLSVRSIDQALTEIRTQLKTQQGDIYSFDDMRGNGNDRRSATLELKVPQENLDKTLEALGKLGNVINTQVKSADVSNQLVDTEARLKNLRQQETMTQKIMDRSGGIKDVLAVSKELAQVREQIERLDAQVKQLKGQVAFSTITLSLEEATASQPNNRSDDLGLQVQDTWNRSTRSASGLIRGLFLFGVGVIPFVPFLLLLGGGLYVVRRRVRSRRVPRA
jgi:archaellum component FlaC